MLELDFAQFVSQFLLPPTLFLILGFCGFLIRAHYPRTSVGLIATSVLSFALCCLPMITSLLMSPLQQYSPVSEQQIQNPTAEMIVVLSAGRSTGYKEYGGDTVNMLGLERVRYGAWLKRRTNLPIIITGGKRKGELKSEAQLMADVLQKEFLIEADLLEERARNTYENALYTAKLLRDRSTKKIYLVTHAWHLARAVEAFENQGIEVIPAPTAFYGNNSGSIMISDLLPNSTALAFSTNAIHEYLGILWYRIRYY